MRSSFHKSYLQHMCRSPSLSEPSRLATRKALTNLEGSASKNFVDWPIVQALFREINATEEAGWASNFVSSIGVAAHGALGFAAISANTLADGLALLRPHINTRIGSYDIELETDEQLVRLVFTPGVEQCEELFTLDEMVCASLVVMVNTILAAQLSEVQISLARDSGGLKKNFPDLVVSQCVGESASMAFPKEWLSMQSQYADENAFLSNVQFVQDQSKNLAQQSQVISESIETRLERFFDNNAINFKSSGRTVPAPTLAMLADNLHMSSRTLIRRLKAENTSYKVLLQSIRQRRAQHYLAQTTHAVEEIAQLLAYTDAGNFIRAFQAWTGKTPSVWREENR